MHVVLWRAFRPRNPIPPTHSYGSLFRLDGSGDVRLHRGYIPHSKCLSCVSCFSVHPGSSGSGKTNYIPHSRESKLYTPCYEPVAAAAQRPTDRRLF
eukprot:604996-Prymnesium_polylepis.1